VTSIDKDPILLKYFRKRHLEPSTQTTYITAWKSYHKTTGLTPTQAIEEADEEEEQRIRLKRRKINDHLDDFEEYLEICCSEETLRSRVSVIRAFYRFNGIQLPEKLRRRPNPTPTEELEDLPNMDDIKRALSIANPKYQSMIMLLASSGIRQGDARGLTLKDLIVSLSKYAEINLEDLKNIDKLKDDLPQKIGPLVWRKWMQKGKKWFTFFSTPESLDFILTHLKIDPPKLFEDDTLIFRTRGDLYLRRTTFNKYFEWLDDKCGFPERTGQIYFRPHNLRKWFGNQLKVTSMGNTDTRLLLGHSVQDSTGQRYLKPDYDDLYKKYYLNMDAVTIYGKVEVHDLTDEKVKKLEERMNKLERENKILKAHREDEKRQ
jgi:integrase